MTPKPREINRESIVEQIQKDVNLLSLPQTLAQILKEVEKEDVSADSLAKIIKNDPSLTSRILKMANSTFYQRFAKTTTVNQAVSVLGITTVVCLALSSSVFRPEIISKESGINTNSFFTYVLSVATACEKIAKEIGFKATEEAFVIGLLNDIGLLFFVHHYPDHFKKVLSKNSEFKTLIEAERNVLGMDHYEISSLLVQKWRLPDGIAKTVGLQPQKEPNDNITKLQDILRLAMQMNQDKFSSFELPLEERLGELAKVAGRLGIEKENLDDISAQLMTGTIEIADHFGVDIGSVEELLIKANQEIWKAYLTIEHLFKVRQELSQQILAQERERGALEAKNAAMATLFHYVNNSAMAIYGRSQMMRVNSRSGKKEKLLEKLENDLNVIDRSIQRIVAVLEEVREITPINQEKLSNTTEAINLDEKIETRMNKMSTDQKWFTEAATEKTPSA